MSDEMTWTEHAIEPTELVQTKRYTNLAEIIATGKFDLEKIIDMLRAEVEERQMALTDEGLVVEWKLEARVVGYEPLPDWDEGSRERFSKMVVSGGHGPLIVGCLDS